MNILLVNKFFYIKGGAETCFFNTADILKKNGHKVLFFSMNHPSNFKSEYNQYFIDNIDYFIPQSLGTKVKNSTKLLYSFEASKRLTNLLKNEKVDIAHLHNIYHQISPSILTVLKKFNIPTVLTLHDYKLVCASSQMLNKAQVCEKCKNGNYAQILKEQCKGGFINSFLLTMEMLLHHKILNIYNKIDFFISPSKFLASKMKEMGFKKEIEHVPNCIDTTLYTPDYNFQENSIVYFGRISIEKGINTLIEAVKDINVNLKIIGDGYEKIKLEEKIRKEKINNVFFLGYRKGQELQDEIKKSMFVVLPSEWYENNPYSIIEAFALGKPAIGSNIGGIPELIIDDLTGYTFTPGDSNSLKEKINILLNKKSLISRMGKNAREFVEKELNTEKYYLRLIEYYKKLLS